MHAYKFCLVFMVLNQVCLGVRLDNAKHVQHYIKKLIDSFNGEPNGGCFSTIINPPNIAETSTVGILLSKVLLRSPQEQFDILLKCPVHGNSLQPSSRTINVSGEKDNGAIMVTSV